MIHAVPRTPRAAFDFRMIWLIVGLAIMLGDNIWSGVCFPSPSPGQLAVGPFTGLHLEQFFYLYVTVSLVFGVDLTYGGFSSRSGQRL